MAKPTWISITPTSGFGNATVTITAAKHTGSASRTGNVTISTTTSPIKTLAIPVTQSAATLNFVEEGYSEIATEIPAIGGKVTFNGTANVRTIRVNPDIAGLIDKAAMVLRVNGTIVPATGDYLDGKEFVLTNNPGAVAEYIWFLDIVFYANTSAVEKLFSIDISTEDINVGVSDNMKLLGAASTLTSTPSSLSFRSVSESKTVDVKSNDNWVAT